MVQNEGTHMIYCTPETGLFFSAQITIGSSPHTQRSSFYDIGCFGYFEVPTGSAAHLASMTNFKVEEIETFKVI
jgi:hypothetical protein